MTREETPRKVVMQKYSKVNQEIRRQESHISQNGVRYGKTYVYCSVKGKKGSPITSRRSQGSGMFYAHQLVGRKVVSDVISGVVVDPTGVKRLL